MKSATVNQEIKNAIRRELLKNKDVPKESEVRYHLGSQLAKTFFGTLDYTGQQYLALVPPGEGPHTCLTLAESEASVRQFALNAPLTSRAVTHVGILDVGGGCLLKYENEILARHRRELVELEKTVRAEEAVKLKAAVAEARKQEREICERRHLELTDTYEKLLFIAVSSVVKTLQRECDKRVQRDCEELDKMLRDQFEYKLSSTIEALEARFKEDTLNRLANQRADFHAYLQYIRQATLDLFHEIDMHHMHALQKLRNDLETANMADICYVTARERKSCQEEKRRIWQRYDETVAKFKKIIEEKEMDITVTRLEIMKGRSEALVWQEKVDEILQEFQKFVAFALKSLPEHSAFLIDRKRLLDAVKDKIKGTAWKKVTDAMESLFNAVMERISEHEREEEAIREIREAEAERRRQESTAAFMRGEVIDLVPTADQIDEHRQKRKESTTAFVEKEVILPAAVAAAPTTFVRDEIVKAIPPVAVLETSKTKRKERERVVQFARDEIENLLTIFRKHPSMADFVAPPLNTE
ncbi:uncharacterized protein LOC126354293 [Schistocerca gregaria]|uniref:uncharacterized protein LOC126354293 n=1 Tax=Schistocerca gregaria TaxID=7010 RepID=UPI00211EC9B0|nr:uncharacterized protein LOC126354293 [Schistocerca gregaria]